MSKTDEDKTRVIKEALAPIDLHIDQKMRMSQTVGEFQVPDSDETVELLTTWPTPTYFYIRVKDKETGELYNWGFDLREVATNLIRLSRGEDVPFRSETKLAGEC